jgi:hypothetical protein
MDRDLFGTLTVRLHFIKRVDQFDEPVQRQRCYSGVSSIARFHGTMEETRAAYKAWLDYNPALRDLVNATFEVRMAVHTDDL